MDIQISSNFERLLFDLNDRDGAAVARLLHDFRAQGAFRLNDTQMPRLHQDFSSGACDDAMTLDTIRTVYADRGILLDPHTAVGVAVARKYAEKHPNEPIVALATAHPAKFPEAVEQASGIRPVLPPALSDLMTRDERFSVLPNDVSAVRDFIRWKSGL